MAKPRRATNAHTSYRFCSADRTIERQALLEEALAGSADAHGALLDSFRPEMVRFFAARLSAPLRQKADEDDLTQIAALRALGGFAGFKCCDLRSYWAWLRKICQNAIHSLTRWSRKAKRDLSREELLNELRFEDGSQHPYCRRQPTAEELFAALESAGQLQTALDQLSQIERQIVSWRAGQGLSFAEIARRLALSDDYVARAYKASLARLRRFLSLCRDGALAGAA